MTNIAPGPDPIPEPAPRRNGGHLITPVSPEPADRGRTDRWIRAILIASIVLVFGFLMFGLFVVPAIYNSRDNSAATQRQTVAINNGQAIGNCRALANTVVTGATADLQANLANVDRLVSQGLEDSINNPAAVHQDLIDSEAARQNLADAAQSVQDAKDAYTAAVLLAKNDPVQFLANCQAGLYG